MKYAAIGVAVAVLSGLKAVFDTLETIKNPPKSAAQRRAEREDCKAKGVGP